MEIAGDGIGTHDLIRPQGLGASAGLGVECFAVEPDSAALGAQVGAITDACDPVPAQAVNGLEPRGAEAGVGDEDGLHARGQERLQLLQKRPVHAGVAETGKRMDLFIQCQAASADRHRGAQQLPAPIGREIAPIHHDQWFAERPHHAAREHLIQLEALGSEVAVAEQPIDTLDIVFRARRPDECAAHLGERESPRAHRGAYRCQQHGQTRGMQTRATRSKQLLYDIERMHGAVSFEGCEPRKRRKARHACAVLNRLYQLHQQSTTPLRGETSDTDPIYIRSYANSRGCHRSACFSGRQHRQGNRF